MSIETAVYDRLNDPSVTAFVADRITPTDPPENVLWPFVVYRVTSNDPVTSLSGATGLSSYALDLDVWARSLAEVTAIADAITARLHCFSGGSIRLATKTDQAAEELGSDEEGDICHATQKYTVWYSGATISATPQATGTVTTGVDSVSLAACSHSLTLDCAGLNLDGSPVTTGGPYQPADPDLTGIAALSSTGSPYRNNSGVWTQIGAVTGVSNTVGGLQVQIAASPTTGAKTATLQVASQPTLANTVLPDQTGNTGKVLGTDGSSVSWVAQTGGGGAAFKFSYSTSSSGLTTGQLNLGSGVLTFYDTDGNGLPLSNVVASLDAGSISLMLNTTRPGAFVGTVINHGGAGGSTLFVGNGPASSVGSFQAGDDVRVLFSPRGATGPSGSNGTNGTGTDWQSGAAGGSAPSGTGTSSASFYVDTDTGKVWQWDTGSSSWTYLLTIQGATGATGATGAANTWTIGSGFPGSGGTNTGDLYLDTSNGDVYQWATGSWNLVSNIHGANGTNGTNGAAWFTGSGSPVGVVTGNTAGDLYLDTSTGNVYQWNGSAWTGPVMNVMGPTGATGGASITCGSTSCSCSGMLYGNGGGFVAGDGNVNTDGSGNLQSNSFTCFGAISSTTSITASGQLQGATLSTDGGQVTTDGSGTITAGNLNLGGGISAGSGDLYIANIHQSGTVDFSASNPSDWAGGSPPTTMASAFDRIAAALTVLGQSP